MGRLFCCNLFVNTGSNKLEDKHADFPIDPIYFLDSSFNIVQHFKGRGRKMDSIHCSCTASLLSTAFSRLAGDAWLTDSSTGGRTELFCGYTEAQLGRRPDLPRHWMLSASGAHPCFWRVQKRFHSNPWYLQHNRNRSLVCVPCLGAGAVDPLGCPVVFDKLRLQSKQTLHMLYCLLILYGLIKKINTLCGCLNINIGCSFMFSLQFKLCVRNLK